MDEHAYLVITTHPEYGVDYAAFRTKAQVQESIDISWSKIPDEKPGLIWTGNRGIAHAKNGTEIEVRLIHVQDRADHL